MLGTITPPELIHILYKQEVLTIYFQRASSLHSGLALELGFNFCGHCHHLVASHSWFAGVATAGSSHRVCPMVTHFSHLSALGLPVLQVKACRCDGDGNFICWAFLLTLLGSSSAWLNEEDLHSKVSLGDQGVVFEHRSSLCVRSVLLNTQGIAKWKCWELGLAKIISGTNTAGRVCVLITQP